jgi:hypothetical protein
MTTLKTAVLSALGAVLLMAAPVSAEQRSMHFSVPFAFHAGEAVLPAGSYTAQMSDGYSLRLISNVDNSVHYVKLAYHAVERKATSEDPALLRFAKMGDDMVLRAVWAPAKTDGYEVKKSQAELEWVRTHPGIAASTVEIQPK